MMEATDVSDRHDVAIPGRRDRTRNRRVFVQRQVRAGPFVVPSGAPKQFFIIKKVGDTLRGMVCGNPYRMAALDDFRIEGNTLKFNNVEAGLQTRLDDLG